MGLYDAFVSYSHAKDKPIAAALQSVVQKLGKPWYRRRALRVFRDDTSLSATPQLWPSIQTALSESGFLILLASPEAAASPWVDKEVAYWLEHKSIDTLLIASTDGELAWDGAAGDFGRRDRMPLPPVLEGRFPTEPKWVDLRPYRDGADPRDAKFTELAADFAAAIRGMPKEDLLSQEVRQQRRALSLAWSAAATLTVLIALAGWQWWEADRAKRAALEAEQVATEQKGIAETQRDRAVEAERSATEQKKEAQAQRDRAVEAERVATEQKNEAQAQRDRALLNQSRFLADAADQHMQRDETTAGMLLALEALPDAKGGVDRPYAASAEVSLFAAWHKPHEVAVLAGHVDEVVSAAFSPDGRLVVTTSADNTARIWDRATGRALHILAGHSDKVKSAEFDPAGRRVVTASASDDGTARIWDVETGEVLVVLKGHKGMVATARFSPDGTRVVTASYDGTARIWDAVTGQTLLIFSEQSIVTPSGNSTPGVLNAAFSLDGSTVVTQAGSSYDHRVRVWSATTGRALSLVGFLRNVRTFDLSPDWQRVLIMDKDLSISVLEFKTGKLIRTLLAGGNLEWANAAFGSDGRVVLITYRDGSTRVWSVEAGQALAVLKGHTERVNGARSSRDGRYVVTASMDRTARIWADDLDDLVSFVETGAEFVAFSPDGLRFATTSTPDASARIWDVKTRRLILELAGHLGRITSIKFSPDNRRLLTGSVDNTARIWDVATGKTINTLSGHAKMVSDASFSPDGARVVTASLDGTARIWDATTGRMIVGVTYGSGRGVNTAVFSPDGRRVLMGAADGRAVIWDVETRKVLTVLAGHKGEVKSAVFSPNGKHIVTASDADILAQVIDRNRDNTARVWDAETGKMLFFLRGHTAGIHTIAFQSDGRRFVTGAADKTTRIWDTGTWETIAVLTGEGVPAISPDGRLVATAGDKVALWKVFSATPELVDAAKQGVGRCLTRAERDAAFLPPEPPAWCIEMEKWPYQDRAWKEWLKAKRENVNASLPDNTN